MPSLPLRPLLAGILIVGILGGMALYTNFLERLKAQAQEEARAREVIVETTVGGEFAIEVTLTFDAAPDTFNVKPEDAASLIVVKQGKEEHELIRETQPIPAHTKFERAVTGLAVGENRLTLRVFPADGFATQARAGRFAVLRDGHELPETVRTFWVDSGREGNATLDFKIPEKVAIKEEK